MSPHMAGMIGQLALLGVPMTSAVPGDNPSPTSPASPTPAPSGTPVLGADGSVGELTEQAKMALSTIQTNQNNITLQIGQLEIRKGQLMTEFNKLQEQARRILNSEALRMGIPDGTSWQITPEGKALLMG